MSRSSSLMVSILVALFWLSGCSGDEDQPAGATASVLQISYEAIPGTGIPLNGVSYDLSMSDATYEEKESFTEGVREDLVPQVLDLLGLSAADVATETTPGGYMLVTNPSIQSRLEQSDEVATALAAALGYSFHQWSVLVTDFSAKDGGTGYTTVRFPNGALTPALAQDFFEHAAAVDPGLGGGYTAFDDDMVFLNLRDDAGAPYSGLDDAEFHDALTEAAGTYTEAGVIVADSGEVRAALVEDDWDAAAPGADYLARIPEAAEITAGLNAVQAQHIDRFVAAVETYSW